MSVFGALLLETCVGSRESTHKDPCDEEEKQHHVAEPASLSFRHLVHPFKGAAQEGGRVLERLTEHAQVVGRLSDLCANVERDLLEHRYTGGQTFESLVILLFQVLGGACGRVVGSGTAKDAISVRIAGRRLLLGRADKVGAVVGRRGAVRCGRGRVWI